MVHPPDIKNPTQTNRHTCIFLLMIDDDISRPSDFLISYFFISRNKGLV